MKKSGKVPQFFFNRCSRQPSRQTTAESPHPANSRSAALLLLTVLFLCTEMTASEKPEGIRITGGSDIVSTYMWRGLREAGVSFQPVLTLHASNFSLSAWGSADFSGKSYKEMDLTVSYEAGPVRFTLADIYCVYPESGITDYRYFNFSKGSPHRIEAGIVWIVTEKIPITIAWYTTLFGGSDYNSSGRRAYASYAELSYPFAVKGIDMKAGIGVVPWNAAGVYGIDRSFYVQNIFIDAGKSWSLKDAAGLQIGLFTSISWNPALADVNFTGGISIRM